MSRRISRVRRVVLWSCTVVVAGFAAFAAWGWRIEGEQWREDIVASREMVETSLTTANLDQAHYAAAQRGLASMQAACDRHESDKVRAMGVNLAMYLAIAGDGADLPPRASDKSKDAK